MPQTDRRRMMLMAGIGALTAALPVPKAQATPDSDELPDWAHGLGLEPNAEGGWSVRTWTSDLTISRSALPPDYGGPRPAGSAIYFLLMPGQWTSWHMVRSSEVWLFHRGSPVLLEFGPEPSSATTHVVGADLLADQQPQVVVPPGYWQHARTRDNEPSLVSCVVVPGFEDADFSFG